MVEFPGEVRRALEEACRADAIFGQLLGSENRVTLLSVGGSDRMFFRVRGKNVFSTISGTVVLLFDARRDRLREYFAAEAQLRKVGLFPPEVIAGDVERGIAVLEDVGDASLFRMERARTKARTEAYRAALAALSVMAEVREEVFRGDPVLGRRRFDQEALRYETRYFAREVLGRWLGWATERMASLDAEFDALAEEVARGPYALMHRDYQSQNLHWRFDSHRHTGRKRRWKTSLERLAILDFQNLTWGPGLYDLVSLVRDPYVRLGRQRQVRLVRTFLADLPNGHALLKMDAGSFKRLYLATALQRHLQACAAYVYLSRVAGKRAFGTHLGSGLRLALEDARSLGSFPGIQRTLEIALEQIQGAG